MKIEAFNRQEGNIIWQQLFNCCGCSNWVKLMMQKIPYPSVEEIYKGADDAWNQTNESDWKEAFTYHPRIGDLKSLRDKFASTLHHTEQEQSNVASASEEILIELQEYNDAYYNKFGFIFIICATGKSASEMLEAIKERINNEETIEMKIASEEQRKIMHLRLQKLFS